MPYLRLFYHLVWATKHRQALIVPEIETRLFDYLCRKAREMDCQILAINGISDHIHLIIMIPAKISVAEVVKNLKGASSHEFANLYWQRGYSALTVSERNLNVAEQYVRLQKEHRRQMTTITRCEPSDDEIEEHISQIREETAQYETSAENDF